MAIDDPSESDAVRRGLEAVADDTPVDWDALAVPADDESRSVLAALKDIERIARAHAPPSASPRAVPFMWGALEVRAVLASGSFGDVYRAWEPRLEREVALKLLRHEPEATQAGTGAIDEGRRLARVRHPNVVVVHGADHIDGRTGIWMELVGGRTLHAIVEHDGPRPALEAAVIGAAVCDGLDAVHRAGLVHRDVKAQNVMRDEDGRVILMDLGAGGDARASGSERGLHGTPLYLAPELLDGGVPTIASDLYAVGVLLHFLVTARYPIDAPTVEHLRQQHQAPSRPRRADAIGPRPLAAIVARALAENPRERFRSSAEMGRALRQFLHAQRRQPVAGLVAPTVLAVAIGAGLAMVGSMPPAATPESRPPGAGLIPTEPIPLPAYPIDMPTPDGQYVSYVAEGTVMRWSVHTGESRVLVRADPAGGHATSSLLSSDGQVAYGWRRPDRRYELRTVSADGRWPRVVIPALRFHQPVPLDWSRDGRRLLCRLDTERGPSDVVVVPIGGHPRVLFTVPAGATVSGVIAADGRHAVVSVAGAVEHDGLHLIDVEGGKRTPLFDGAARLPQWMPDQRHVFFLRTNEHQMDGWVVPAFDGPATVAPSLVGPDLGILDRVRVTDDGLLYRISTTFAAEVYTAYIERTTGSLTGQPTRVDPALVGGHVGPAWSPDGNRLAYFRIRQTVPGALPQRTLVVRDLAAGESRVIPVSLPFVGGYTPRWSPDGRYVVIWGRDEAPPRGWGYFLVDVETGDTQLLVRLALNAPAWAQYLADGSAFLYTHPTRGIVRHDLASRAETIAVPPRGDARPRRFVLAPDGRTMALVWESGSEDAWVSTIEIRQAGARAEECWRVRSPDWLDVAAWLADGQRLLVAAGTGNEPAHLWSLEGDSCTRTDLRFRLFQGPNTLNVSPDGERIAYGDRLLVPELRVSRLSPP